MARYQYQARDNSGTLATGVVAAGSAEEASRVLRGEGKYIVRLAEIAEVDAAAPGMSLAQHSRRCKRNDVIYFAHQMAIMIDTGVPISEALESITDQVANPSFKAILRDITDAVQGGVEFSTALARHPRVFPTIMVSLMKAAEVSGTLGQMLEKVSEYLTKEQRITKQVKGALMYPAFMICMTIGVTVFLLTFVLPKFATIYSSRGQSLPGATQFLMATSSSLVDYWPWWLAGTATAAISFFQFNRTSTGRRSIDWLKLNAPLFKHLFTQLYVSRSTRTMGTIVNAGVPMLDAVAITKQVTTNCYYEQLWDEVAQGLEQGMQLSDPLAKSTLIPKPIVQMIRSGEKSGRLGQILCRIGEFSEEEFDRAVKASTQFIEPVMIGVMGSIIGFVAIALLLPIFSVGKVAAGN